MIIFLYGRDSYRLKQNLDKIAAEYWKKHPSGLNFSFFDLDESGIEKLSAFEDAVKTVSFFDEKQLFVLKNAFGFGTEIAGVIKKWDLVGDKQRILIFAENSPGPELAKKDKELFGLLAAKPNLVKESKPLSGKKLETWLASQASELGIGLERKALTKLVNYVGNDSWRLALELDKLASYKTGTAGKTISVNDIELLVTPIIDLNIFETIDALGNRDKTKALVLLTKHLETGEDPYYLFSMIVYQFRNLLRVKSLAQKYLALGDIVKKTGLHPFVARKIFDQAKKFELDELKDKFSRLAEGDVKIKNGQVDIVDYLYQVALS